MLRVIFFSGFDDANVQTTRAMLAWSANPMRIMEGIFFTLEMIFCRSSDGDWARFMRSSFRHLCFIRLPLDVFGRSPKPLKRQKGRFKLKVMLRS